MLDIESHTVLNGVQVDTVSGFGASYGVAFDGDRRAYIPDFKNGNYIRLSPDLAQHQVFDVDGDTRVDATIDRASAQPHEVSFDDRGNTYVTCYAPAGWRRQRPPVRCCAASARSRTRARV